MEIEPKSDQPATRLPGEYIREELKARGWTQDDLAHITGRPLPTVNEIIQGKRAIMPEMAVALGMAFGTGADVWMGREAAYRLSLVKAGGRDVEKRARLFELAPIKDMQRRGWIRSTDNLEDLERDVLTFFEIGNIHEEPALVAVMKKSAPNEDLTAAQRAWCFRVRQVAKSLKVAEYRADRLPQCERELRKAAAYSQETAKVPTILASYGIRFIVVEPFPGNKIDGMATWLNETSPVIGLSLRFDRVDGFWHTLCHELSHIRHGDVFSIDSDLADPGSPPLSIKSAVERRADSEAAAMLIPPSELESFIARVGPLYSKARINQFANRLKVHPGIIVGQLQHRGEIGYSANRETLVKVRHIVAPVALTDGWGHSINPRVFE